MVTQRFFLLSFCVFYAVHGVFYTLTEQIFFAALSLTFRGNEAGLSCGLFHAYWAISSCGLCFGKCFLTGFDHSCSLPLNDFLLPLFKPSAFLLRLNNLSSLGFLRNAWTRNSYVCVVFFWPWTMISWFVLTLELSARLQNTRQSICSDWKTLENQSANLQANSGLEGILSKPIFLFRRRL